MTTSLFTIGDIVMLKTGGAFMCVLKLRGDSAPFYVECVWHEGNKPRHVIYHEDVLVHVPTLAN
jgi:uncharacterized protein YodC (DUF2158 family)